MRCLFASVELALNAIESKVTNIPQFNVMFLRENSFSNSFRIDNNSSNIIGHHAELDIIYCLNQFNQKKECAIESFIK